METPTLARTHTHLFQNACELQSIVLVSPKDMGPIQGLWYGPGFNPYTHTHVHPKYGPTVDDRNPASACTCIHLVLPEFRYFWYLKSKQVYYTVLYGFILYYITLYYTVLYFTILYYIILYCTILYYTRLYYTNKVMQDFYDLS